MVTKRVGRPGQPAGHPPYPAAGAVNHSPSPKSPKSQFRHCRTKSTILAHYNALAAGDTDVDVAA